MALVPFANKRPAASQPPSPFDGLFENFSLLERLDDFRRRLVRSALAVCVGIAIGFGFINQVVLRSLDDPAEYHAEVRWVNRDYRDRFSAHEDKATQALLQKGAAILEAAPTHRLYVYV